MAVQVSAGKNEKLHPGEHRPRTPCCRRTACTAQHHHINALMLHEQLHPAMVAACPGSSVCPARCYSAGVYNAPGVRRWSTTHGRCLQAVPSLGAKASSQQQTTPSV